MMDNAHGENNLGMMCLLCLRMKRSVYYMECYMYVCRWKKSTIS